MWFDLEQAEKVIQQKETITQEEWKLIDNLKEMFIPFLNVLNLYVSIKNSKNKYKEIKIILHESWVDTYFISLKIKIKNKIILVLIYKINILSDKVKEIYKIKKYISGYEKQLEEFYIMMVNYIKEYQNKKQQELDYKKAEQKLIVFGDYNG
jgi:hypothetical protein